MWTRRIPFISSLFVSATVDAQHVSTEYGPRAFDVKNKWTAIVAAYEPEIKAIDTAIAKLADARIHETVTFQEGNIN